MDLNGKEIAFIGLGDVGSRYSSGITKNHGAKTRGYDLKFGLEEFAEKENRCREAGVRLVSGTKEVVEDAPLVLAITTVGQAIETAEGAAKYLKPGQIYVDFNSAIPSVKAKVQEIIEATGADFCDACTMVSPIRDWERTKVVISGKRAPEVQEVLNSWGMNLTYLGPNIGQASAYKVLRSIYTKGLEAVLIEALSSAYAYGIFDQVWDSIKTMMAEDAETLYSRMVRTNVVHSKRRADEIEAITGMLSADHRDCTMAAAAYKKLVWSANCGIKEHFNNAIPENLEDALAYWASVKEE
ncbi:MAG: NAD(P)-dependent oxidoreductase [Lachnospiraceae bacterium]|nr:NAD(P)-dependent oxidoreductase [Lachnospiraceae bacterium]